MKNLQDPRRRSGRPSCLAVHAELARLLAEGRRVAVATVVRTRGSHPRDVGAKMLVTEAGGTAFTIGGGALEASVIADCRSALAGEGPGLHRYDLTEAGEDSVGMTCGGQVEVFVDVEDPPHRLIVFGAGHVGRAVAHAAHVAGLAVTVVDDRADWLEASAFPPGAALHRCARDYETDLPALSERDLAAVMTRCHETDVTVLRELSVSRPQYVGFMGSRRKVLRARRRLEAQGVAATWLDSVRGPIGLSIGAETPGEIAISVVAEIVAEIRGEGRRGRDAKRAVAAVAAAARPDETPT